MLQELEGAQAFIWCLGLSSTTDLETTRKVSIDYTMAGLQALRKVKGGAMARFVYLGGILNERDQERSLWLLGNLRRARVRYKMMLQYVIRPFC